MRALRLALLALAFTLAGSVARADEAIAPRSPATAPVTAPAPKERPRMEVAFVLDTTGSMGGLLETAKRKIWSIANALVRAKPSPELRLGLVAFRDRGDDYVTRLTDLDADLDRVYRDLVACAAGGGGDGPESVNQALREAVTKLSWTPGEKVLKVVFLVGDAPPHMDYENDVAYAATCEQAVRAGIVINTLRCGGDPSTEKVWAEVARLSEGTYASIPQEENGAVATPYDERIAALGGRMSEGFLSYGRKEDRDDAREKLRAGAAAAKSAGESGGGGGAGGASVAADRAGVLMESGRLDATDLVAAVVAGTVKLDDLKDADLPEEMAKLDAEGRRAFLETRTKEREVLNREMAELNGKRAAFLLDAAKKAAGEGRSAFDLEVAKALRAQAAKKGFSFGE